LTTGTEKEEGNAERVVTPLRGARNNAPTWGYSSHRLRRCVMTYNN
jgi:hypothetical protein